MRELSLEEIQSAAFGVLKKLKEICEREGIVYFLLYGTLLGAVRHQGFIPWDDDVDVGMPRREYERFVEYCKNHREELKPFELFHHETSKKYIYPIARLSDSRYTLEYKDAKEYGLGVFVDIYPFDGAPRPRAHRKLLHLQRLAGTLGVSHYIKCKNPLKNLIKFPYYHLVRHRSLNKVLKKLDALGAREDFEKSAYVTCAVWGRDHFYAGRDFQGIELLRFEGELFPVPKGYDGILTLLYGNYLELPPEDKRIPHHFYRAFERES